MNLPRLSSEQRMRFGLELSERHMKMWGDDCPAVDMDFLLNEYNHGVPVAIVEYKHFRADLTRSHENNLRAIQHLYDEHGAQLPLLVARYWPDTWAFKVKAWNAAARAAMGQLGLADDDWQPMSEQEFVRLLYRFRKDALTRQDDCYLRRLNTEQPPREDSDRRVA